MRGVNCSNIAVIGGGAAGMMAAIAAAQLSSKSSTENIFLFEKNEKLGKKLHITGKGRCNLTNNTDVAGLLAQVNSNPRFLNSAFYNMDSSALMNFFEQLGVPLKTERGGRVFPTSEKSDDINKALAAHLRGLGVNVKLNCAVQKIESGNAQARFALYANGEIFNANAVIIATGGLSYPATGSTGDGYKFAKIFGHDIIPTLPSLVALITSETWVSNLEGLSLKNVRVTAKSSKGKTLFEDTGEMIFTHGGISGPLILSASAFFPDITKISIDLKPALSPEQLDTRILRDFSEYQNKNFTNSLDDLLPKRLIETIIFLSQIPQEKKINSITKNERQTLVNLLKNLTLTPTATAGFKEAVITKGGVNVREINPSTLMSKKQAGLFFAGEVMDVDAMTGGYNLQIAFSTGQLAGESAAEYCNERSNQP